MGLDLSRFALMLGVVGWGAIALPVAQAQITPDATLGAEASVVVPNTVVRELPGDLIEGGALRESSLFHSFGAFNVEAGQRVYFANPAGVENIFGRVTGANPSNILGTLGVDGAASLFLLNPNGIVFGPEASLDIEGSFFATTAERLEFEDGQRFSALAPGAAPVLRVTVPLGLQAGPGARLTESGVERFAAAQAGFVREGSAIRSEGTLRVGGDLGLLADGLDLSGQVVAGGDLGLRGVDSVRIRDGVEEPFVAASRGAMVVQGDEVVDIFALSNAGSGLISGGDMVLRSAQRVGGDAHYFSRGGFRVEDLAGEAGELYSPVDPIVRAFGDVEIGRYEGSSLHILAGGSVSIGTAVITQPDVGMLGVDFLRETITLSDGTVVEVDGGAQPTLDVRAGVRAGAIGTEPLPVLTGGGNTDRFLDSTVDRLPESSDIRVGDVAFRATDGLVLLTNQYEPNSEVPGGKIVIDGNGQFGFGINARNSAGKGGEVFIDSRNDIEVVNSSIQTTAQREVGDVVLVADGTVRFDGLDGSRGTGALSSLAADGEGSAGDVRIIATNLEVLNGAQLNSAVFGKGQGGNVQINLRGTAQFEGSNPINGRASGAFSNIEATGDGKGGNVEIAAANLEVLSGAQLSASTFGKGDAGSVVLTIAETAKFEGSDPIDGSASGAFSSIEPNGDGKGGNVQINAANLEVLGGAQLSASTLGTGRAGSIVLNISDKAQIDGFNSTNQSQISGIFSRAGNNATGGGGIIDITAKSLEVSNRAIIDTDAFGRDQGAIAGNINITTDNLLIRDNSRISVSAESTAGRQGGKLTINSNSIELRGVPGSDDQSGLFANGRTFGKAGNIELSTENLLISDGAQVQASTKSANVSISINANVLELLIDGVSFQSPVFLEGDAGNITINASSIKVIGTGSNSGDISQNSSSRIEGFGGIFADSLLGGRGGNIVIKTDQLNIENAAQVRASTNLAKTFSSVTTEGISAIVDSPPGKAGNIIVEASGDILISDLGSRLAVETSGNAAQVGDLEISANQLTVKDGAEISANSLAEGSGSSGNLNIDVSTLSLDNGSITAETLSGKGGNINISASKEILLSNESQVTAATQDGQGGDVNISSNRITLDTRSQITAQARMSSSGGTIDDPTGSDDVGGSTGIIDSLRNSFNPFDGTFNPFVSGGAGGSLPRLGGTGGLLPQPGNSQNLINSGNLPHQEGNSQNLINTEGAGTEASNRFAIGNAGNVNISASKTLKINDSTITTSSELGSGGQITISGGSIALRGDADILSFVGNGEGGGGDIVIDANYIIAFDDSDILAFSTDGLGGAIDLSRTPYFGINYFVSPNNLSREELFALDGNSRSDINATGGIASGPVLINDTSSIEASLTDLPESILNPDSLIANSCVARSETEPQGRFLITGTGGLPPQPGDPLPSTYTTAPIQAIPAKTDTPARTNGGSSLRAVEPQPGITEPSGVYRLANGRLVMSRECEETSPAQTPTSPT